MGNATLADLARRAVPFLRDEAAKYEDDGSNEPLELVREIEAALSRGEPMSPEDRFEQFVQAEIARAPEPLRALGSYLADTLDEDKFPKANALLLQLATSPEAGMSGWCRGEGCVHKAFGEPIWKTGDNPFTTAAQPTQPASGGGVARDGYYLASFKRSHDRGYVIWWMPDNAGYTTDLEQAGIYAEPVLGYHDSDDTVPVPVALIDSLRVRRMIDVGDSANRSLWTAPELRQRIATWAKERPHA